MGLLYDSRLSRQEHAIVEVGEGQLKSPIDIDELQSRLGILELRQQAGFENTLKAEQSRAIQEENWRRQEAGRLLKQNASTRLECSEGAAAAFRSKLHVDETELDDEVELT